MRNRSVVFVIRNKKILMEKLNYPSEGKEPITGYDPEEAGNENPPLKEVLWMGLDEISEKDRAFLFGYGLIQVPGFFEEVKSWDDEISYPGK